MATSALRSLTAMAACALSNLVSRRRAVERSGPIVSVTTYGARTRLTFLALESIARGSVRPSRLVLWIDEPAVVAKPPRTLARLVRRGLEIRPTPDHGPHKKYFPSACDDGRGSRPVITADDDWILPRGWLASLMVAHRASPTRVLAHRAHSIALVDDRIAPYSTWGPAAPGAASVLNFGTGCHGQLLPPALLDRLRDAGTAFEECAPWADDVWIHATAIDMGLEVMSVGMLPEESFVPIRGGGFFGGSSLFESNLQADGNDRQIEATYSERAREAIARATASEGTVDAGEI